MARNIFSDERGSLSDREIGPHGPIVREFYHDAKGAIAKLRELKTGEAVDALWHPELDEDVVLIWGHAEAGEWGEPYGLAHIERKHGIKTLDELPDVFPTLKRNPDKDAGNNLVLESPTHKAVVTTQWRGNRKVWLLTFYGRMPSASEGLASVPEAPLAGVSGTTPPLEGGTSSLPKGTDFVKTPEYQAAVARGAQLLAEGVTRFADWSRRMLAEFGERIKPYLTRLYFEAKRFWQDTSGQSTIEIRAINALTEHARNLARGVRTRVGQRARRSAIVELLDIVFMPLESRLAGEGQGAGRPLMEALKRAGDWGEVSAGRRVTVEW